MTSSAPGPLTAFAFRAAAHTDVGLLRESNEDTILLGDLDRAELSAPADGAAQLDGAGARGPLMLVCDGMGGVAGGEVASDLAARVTWRELAASPGSLDAEVFARLLRRAVRIANGEVHAVGKRDPGLRGMGTTLTAAAVVGTRLVVANVGDSRAYVLRGDRLVQVSRDQSLASALAAAGHPQGAVDRSGAILQALGVASDCEPSLSLIDLRRADRILLCSDGLYNLLGEGTIGTIAADPRGPAPATRLLVDAARAAGGSDNISVVLLEVDGERFPESAGEDDLPRFREFDPQQEGDPALTSTSQVQRRLAARVGLAANAKEMAIPVTGQHLMVRRPPRAAPAARAAEAPPPRRLWPYLAALVIALIVLGLALR
ncbi:MAG: protein phosphatase 2C domain-containing protein [Kofleriaceae bacterium]